MADTHGFDVVVAAGAEVLRKVLRGAWKSAECPSDVGNAGRFPEEVSLDETDGIQFGTYVVLDGQIQLPQNELDASLAPDINGAELKFGLHLQLEIKDPTVPSARLLDMSADVRAKVPIGLVGTDKSVYLLLENLPRSNVAVVLTSGDPLAPKIDLLMREYVHALYEANGTTFPHTIAKTDVGWLSGSIVVDAYTEIYDDAENPAHRIEVSRPDPSHIEISIPVYLRIYNIRRSGLATFITLQHPMGIETRMLINAPFDSPSGSYTARLSVATVTVSTIVPAGPEHGVEGPNYTTNKATIAGLPLINLDLDATLSDEIRKAGEDFAKTIGDRTILVPTVEQIEAAIGNYFHLDLEARDKLSVWTPTDVPDAAFAVNDVGSQVFADMLAIALNASPGADINALTNFIPAGRDFAIALSAARVNAAIAKSRADSDLENSDLPKRISSGDDEVDLNELAVFLTNGSIRIEGEVTVIDAIAGSIDVDADFTADQGLTWADNPDGTQRIDDFALHEPDIDPEESVLLWVLGLLIGLLTGGVGGGIIAVIVILIIQAIVEEIATSIGAGIIQDQVSGAAVGFGGWPARLARIGRVETRFLNPIDIAPSGLVMAGTLEVISSCEETAIAFADSGGSYTGAAAAALTLAAQTTHADASYHWIPGDGSPLVNAQQTTHKYVASGLYLAKHSLTINQPGGVTTRHFALVDVKNVAPSVDAGSDITVNEGEVVTLVGHFVDVEYPDTHESSWIFGDHQPPQPGTLVETNTPPHSSGSSTVQHAWCQNGQYIVTLTVRDHNGGLTSDTRTVTVLNVPPVVKAPSEIFVHRCMVLTLTAKFTDPGWCDSHTGLWDFGDCSPEQTATIREKNEPPAAQGTAVASHVYEKCGDFQAVCTVIDEDGAAGSARTIVHVIELCNPGFEHGFRKLRVGKVGNHWQPYVALSQKAALTLDSAAKKQLLAGVSAIGDVFECEECIVHGGQRSQRIEASRDLRWGIFQGLGANAGWEYEVSTWYSLAQAIGGTARLGIDPAGGTDPTAPSIVWNAGTEREHWSQLSERVIASAQAITIFVEIEAGDERLSEGWIDDIAFVSIQPFCPEQPEEERPERPEKPKRPAAERCVDFRKLKPNQTLGSSFASDGFTFTSRSQLPLQVTGAGVPVGAPKLAILGGGIVVTLPLRAEKVVAKISDMGGKPPEMAAMDASGAVIGRTSGTGQSNALQVLEIAAAGIARLTLIAQEAALYELCVYGDPRSEAERELRVELTGAPVISLTDPVDNPGVAKQDRPVEIDPSAQRKFDPRLREAARQRGVAAHTEFSVMLTVHGANPALPAETKGPERAELIGKSFEQETHTLRSALARNGAQDIQALWISRAISARMPLSAIIKAAHDESVKQIMLVVPFQAISPQKGSGNAGRKHH